MNEKIRSAGTDSVQSVVIQTPINNEQLDQSLVLISLSLGGQSKDDFAHDFPVWKRLGQDEPRGITRWVALDKNRVIGTTFMRLTKVHINENQTLPVAIIGGVSVHPGYRGKGIGAQLLKEATQEADKQRIPLSVLWGRASKLYQQFGFLPLTGQIEVNINRLNASDSALSGEWKPGYHFDIFQKRVSLKEGLVLTNADIAWYSLHDRVQWWRYIEKNQMKGYFAVGRGIDLSGIIHEWWVDRPETMQQCLPVLQRKTGATALIASIKHREELSVLEYPILDQTLCLARVSGPMSVKDLNSIWFWGLDSA